MRRSDCFFEKVSHVGLGMALMFIAMGIIVMGVTAWPVFGVILGISVLILSAYFFSAPASQACRLG